MNGNVPRLVQRRAVLAILASGAFDARGAPPKPATFADLFRRAERDVDRLNLPAIRQLREGAQEVDTKAIAPRNARSNRSIAEDAVRLIVFFEVTSKKLYEKAYQRPLWPGGDSGVTVGIGYDLGYAQENWVADEWGSYLNTDSIDKLKKACGIKGGKSKSVAANLSDVIVPWKDAETQFRKHMLPLYIGETLRALPTAATLSDKSLGALVSLVYNRGASFSKDGENFDEMRAIRQALLGGKYDAIPSEFTKMKRLWDIKKYPGLHIRREMEAALFREGL